MAQNSHTTEIFSEKMEIKTENISLEVRKKSTSKTVSFLQNFPLDTFWNSV